MSIKKLLKPHRPQETTCLIAPLLIISMHQKDRYVSGLNCGPRAPAKD